MSEQLDCYYNDYVVFEGDLVEDLADEKHGEEVKEIITNQSSYIETVANLKALESKADTTIDTLGEIVDQAQTAETESNDFAAELEKFKTRCKADCNNIPQCIAACDNIKYDSTIVTQAVTQLDQAYNLLKDNEVLAVSQLIETEINKVEVVTDYIKLLLDSLGSSSLEPLT